MHDVDSEKQRKDGIASLQDLCEVWRNYYLHTGGGKDRSARMPGVLCRRSSQKPHRTGEDVPARRSRWVQRRPFPF